MVIVNILLHFGQYCLFGMTTLTLAMTSVLAYIGDNFVSQFGHFIFSTSLSGLSPKKRDSVRLRKRQSYLGTDTTILPLLNVMTSGVSGLIPANANADSFIAFLRCMSPHLLMPLSRVNEFFGAGASDTVGAFVISDSSLFFANRYARDKYIKLSVLVIAIHTAVWCL